jgi:hypothetical protein
MRLKLMSLLAIAATGCGAEPARTGAGVDVQQTAGQSTATGPSLSAPSSNGSRESDGISIRLDDADGASRVIGVYGISAGDLQSLAEQNLSESDWDKVLSVRVVEKTTANWEDRPPILGSHRVVDDRLEFVPRFALEPGLTYRARFDLTSLRGVSPERDGINPFTKQPTIIKAARENPPKIVDLGLPERVREPTAVVVNVFPTTDTLPENQLKFYIHFSEPMSRGEAYHRVHLLSASGTEIDAPFLELDEELWDPQGRRFTIFLDPGRIKRGLKPREDVGPVFEEGKSYELVIDSDWHDAMGTPMRQAFRKSFHVEAPDDRQPDPNDWKVTAPAAGSTDPLVVQFSEPLDNAMLLRVIVVRDASDALVMGKVEIADHEKRWSLTPTGPWKNGEYTLEVQTDLEDLAGNSIARVFDVDLMEPISRSIKAERLSLPFQVR